MKRLVIILLLSLISNSLLVTMNSTNFYSSVRVNSHVIILNTEKLDIIKSIRLSKPLVYIGVGPDASFKLFEYFISRANYSILLATYEFWSLDLYDLIANAIKRGVKVRILLENDCYRTESFGDNDQYNRYIAYKFYQLKQQGYDVQVKLESNASAFLHAKFIIIDNETVIVGSGNFIPTSIPKNPYNISKVEYSTAARNWYVAIKDAFAASTFVDEFLKIYSNAVDYNPDEDGTGYPITASGTISYSPDFSDVLVFEADKIIPVFSPENSLQELKEMLSSANHCVYIQQIYVYSSSTGVSDLVDVLRTVHDNKGVTVQFIIEDNYPGNFDDANVTLSAYGFHVVPAFKYASPEKNLFSHVKGIIVDDYLVFVGSINWSGSALLKNYEAGVIIASRDVGIFFRKVFEHDWNLSSTNAFDSDGDGLSDYFEIEHNINPNSKDTDGDGYDDYTEVMILGSDPTDPSSPQPDTEPPTINILSPANNSIVSSRKINIRWGASDNVGVKLVTIYINGSKILATTTSSGSKTVILDEGVWNITILAEDVAGNKASSYVLITVTIKELALSVISPQNSSYINCQNILVNWSYPEEFGELIEWTVYANGSHVANGSIGSYANITLQEGFWNITILAKGTDADGFATIFIWVDLTPPTIIIESPTNNSVIMNTSIELKYQVVDNYELENVTAYLDGKTICSEKEVSKVIQVSEGNHNLTIVAIDAAGNEIRAVVFFTVVIRKPYVTQETLFIAICAIIIIMGIIIILMSKGLRKK